MATGIIALITGLLKLGILILTEYFEDRKRAREAKEESERKQKSFDEIADLALARMKEENRKAREKDQDFQDRLDGEIKGK